MTETKKTDESLEGWAILELMGHRRLGGKVREATIAGAAFIRIDVPATSAVAVEPFTTQFYSPAAVYCLTPTTEAIARALSKREQPTPVHRFEIAAEKPKAESDYEVDFEHRRNAEDDGS